MLTGELRSQINQIWNTSWSYGVSNPLWVIEQITFMLFIKRLDDLDTLEEYKAATLGIVPCLRAYSLLKMPDGRCPKN
jgi:type I restriction enzyme M protein